MLDFRASDILDYEEATFDIGGPTFLFLVGPYQPFSICSKGPFPLMF